MGEKWVRGAIVMLVLVTGWYYSCCCGCLEEERIALLNLKHSIRPPTGNVLASWERHGDCCKWVEIEYNITTKRVIKLSLNNTRDWNFGHWYLNSSLFLSFKELKSLFLHGNYILGFMKNEGLERLSSLSNLKVLDLSYNQLNNSILSSLASLSSLKVLNLAFNEMEGSLHNPGVKRPLGLSKLEVLYLSGNSFNNMILSSLRGLPSLKILDLSNNKLKGPLNIKELVALNELNKLDLSNNNVKSFMAPKGIKRALSVSNLEVIHLSDNSFNNTTLSSLRGLPSLKILDLSRNKLKGILNIKELVALNNLKELDLSENEVESFVAPKDSHTLKELEVLLLDGSSLHNNFLQSIGTLNSLKVLSVSNCELNGTLPSRGWCELKNLEELDLSGNNFEGMLPSCLGNLSYLQVLDVSFNHFRGNITTSPFTNLKSLEYLSFSNNNFQVPNSFSMFANHSKLKVLMGDANNLVPEPLLQTPTPKFQLIFLSLSNLALKKPPYFLHHQNVARFVDLCHNNITGGFPSWLFMNNTALEALHLGYNCISGPLQLPTQHHFNIAMLDVSGNSLLGNLPINMIPNSFSMFANHSKLKVLMGDANNLVPEPLLQTPTPKFQLIFLSLSYLALKEPPYFLRHQNVARAVDLFHNNITGGLPSWLFMNNTALKGLRLGYNCISGPLQLPAQRHFNITILDVSGNSLQRNLPINMSSVFPHLKTLIMSKNSFEGQIPTSFGDMKSLESLSLPNNHISGNIPDSFGRLSFLSYLDLSNNQLSGGIPELLVLGCPLNVLRLSNNNLEGQVFPLLFNLTKLSVLKLGSNNFEGKIPEFSSINSFYPWIIDMSNNHISGKLPRWMGNISFLQGLSLAKNHFEGPFPIEFCGLHNLEFLDLSDNYLSGSIPECFNPISIEYVHLSNNRLNGPLTKAFSRCSSLETLDLTRNNLTGIIPGWIGSLPSLSFLLLKANCFEGEIPVQLCQLNKLKMLDLSQNNLSGSIPFCLSNLTFEALVSSNQISYWMTGSELEMICSLVEISRKELAKNGIVLSKYGYELIKVEYWVEFTTKGMSHVYNGSIFRYMSGIDLSCNRLTGRIPTEIGYLNKIHALNMSHNKLTGLIPTTFSNLKQIESLDISYNNLNGKIPPQLIELNTLAVFSVAYNNLSGPTPDQKA
ncbi:hypothetical protein SLEP1_g6928 [Rubroshorea leprosula]|uniref:Leucine-rich repeat-containing N-terminal plant-type domain-containing protein n=1 Tax=Rubroshorea leprosula TaxID=152421 RepID=A0AAV5I1C7_9ROSI|nr:hypothetical protein SLEP1_g6928 [Rubroshorea leprosula]